MIKQEIDHKSKEFLSLVMNIYSIDVATNLVYVSANVRCVRAVCCTYCQILHVLYSQNSRHNN